MSILKICYRKDKYTRFLFLIILIVFCISCTRRSKDTQDKSQKKDEARLPLDVNAKVDKPVAEVGDIINYTITVNAIPEIVPEFLEAGADIQGIGLRIVDMGSVGPSEIDNRRVWERWYKMEADIVGSYIIPPFEIVYSDAMGKEFKLTTAQIFIEVKSSVLSDPNQQFGDDIKDINPLEKIELGFSIYFWIALIIACLLIVALIIFYFYKKKRKNVVHILVPADKVALTALEQLKNIKLLDKGDFREYYFRLSEIFRQYLEMRYKHPAVEMTTEELIPFLSGINISRELKDISTSVIKRADMAKFAKSSPSFDVATKDWDDVSDFVLKTAQRPNQVNQEK